jgi:hypothetical protein
MQPGGLRARKQVSKGNSQSRTAQGGSRTRPTIRNKSNVRQNPMPGGAGKYMQQPT